MGRQRGVPAVAERTPRRVRDRAPGRAFRLRSGAVGQRASSDTPTGSDVRRGDPAGGGSRSRGDRRDLQRRHADLVHDLAGTAHLARRTPAVARGDHDDGDTPPWLPQITQACSALSPPSRFAPGRAMRQPGSTRSTFAATRGHAASDRSSWTRCKRRCGRGALTSSSPASTPPTTARCGSTLAPGSLKRAACQRSVRCEVRGDTSSCCKRT